MLHIPKKALLMAARLRPQEVFATSLYTGNGSTRTITNGLDLAGKGGLTWIKRRSATADHMLFDTARLARRVLKTNSTAAEAALSDSYSLTEFTGSGFTVGANPSDISESVNFSGSAYAAWSFRRAPKFFDIVTYTGDGVAGRQIPHDLGGVPGMIVVKRRNAAFDWAVAHRSLPTANSLQLNTSNVALVGGDRFRGMDAATFAVSANGDVNEAGATYVAYVFAQNPDLIDCGSYTGNGSATGPVVTCGSGWKPQFIIAKNASSAADWITHDTARGIVTGADPQLRPNLSNAENTGTDWLDLTANGFQPKINSVTLNQSGQNYIYLAIREPT